MAIRTKANQTIITFLNYEDAVNTKKEAEERIELINENKTIALIATIGGLLLTSVIFPLPIVISIFCYIKVKCFNGAWKWGVNCAKWAWLLCPVFPLDLMLGIGGFLIGMMAFFFLPYFVLKGVEKKAKEEILYADAYISEHHAQ